MRIELLVVPDCPSERAAAAQLRQALDDLGLGSETFDVIVVEDQTTADELGFIGSPTFAINGRDLFAQSPTKPALACRLYPDGAPVPRLDQLCNRIAARRTGQ